MTQSMKLGLVLLLIGGAFWLGKKNVPERVVMTAPIERVYRDAVEPDDVAALRDCNDALSAYAVAVEKHWNDSLDRSDVLPPPALRFRSPEGEIVTYKILPLRDPGTNTFTLSKGIR